MRNSVRKAAVSGAYSAALHWTIVVAYYRLISVLGHKISLVSFIVDSIFYADVKYDKKPTAFQGLLYLDIKHIHPI